MPDLPDLVADVLATSDAADPHTLAAEVLNRLTPDDYPAALLSALPGYIKQRIQRVRADAGTTFPIPATDTNPGPTRFAGNRSSRVAAIRDAWQARLQERVAVGNNEWKFLADCTADDLRTVAAARRDHAERALRRAQEYDRLAAAVEAKPGASTVADLGDTALQRLLTAA